MMDKLAELVKKVISELRTIELVGWVGKDGRP
jgi:hypothetical protein